MENKGFIILDKPSGPTSHKATELVKGALDIKKAGHGGTLDPKVTGVLVIGLGKATRLLRFLPSEKEYEGEMHLHSDINLKTLRGKIKEKFLGKIKQTPPKRSKVKRQEREREIYKFKLTKKKGRDVFFKVKCQAGTYIRKLIHDLGEEFEGAHMAKLIRTKHGKFSIRQAKTIEGINKLVKRKKINNLIIPIEKALNFLPKIYIKEKHIKQILNGSPIFSEFIKKVTKKQAEFYALWHNKKIIGVYRIENKKFMPEVVLK